MTAKEALREIVDEMSEEDAARIFPFLSGRTWDEGPPELAPRLSNKDLLMLPRELRSMIIRREISQLSEDEIAEYGAEAEAWIHSDAEALEHIDDD